MLEVTEMSQEEIARLLGRGWYGHLGCSRDGHPYVVPMSYAYDDDEGDIYFFTTEGTKTEFIAANHEVCFQIEEVEGADNWRSVMLTAPSCSRTPPKSSTRCSSSPSATPRSRPGSTAPGSAPGRASAASPSTASAPKPPTGEEP
jgi:hypothetical protein